MKLTKEDLQRVANLWDDVITPACLDFEKETGKAAEAFLEAITAGIGGRAVKQNSWNNYEQIWWDNQPQIEDATHTSESLFHCGSPTFDWHVQGGSTMNAMPSIRGSARA